MKVTSQTRSPIWVILIFWPAKTWLQLIFRAFQQIRPQLVTITVASANGYVSSSKPRYTRADRVYTSAGTFIPNAWCGRSRL
jgi:hypothetical protein